MWRKRHPSNTPESSCVTRWDCRVRGLPLTKTPGRNAPSRSFRVAATRSLSLPHLDSYNSNEGDLNCHYHKKHELKGSFPGLMFKNVNTDEQAHTSTE